MAGVQFRQTWSLRNCVSILLATIHSKSGDSLIDCMVSSIAKPVNASPQSLETMDLLALFLSNRGNPLMARGGCFSKNILTFSLFRLDCAIPFIDF